MMGSSELADQMTRLDRLVALQAQDPDNLSLLSEAAAAALDARLPERARDMLQRYAKLARLPEREAGMAAFAAMQCGDYEAAASQYATLLDRHAGDTSLRFNLAWSRVMLKDHLGAMDLLDRPTTSALPQAAALRIQLLHDQGMFEEAFAEGGVLLGLYPDNQPILASMSTLALDMEDTVLAAKWAQSAGDHPDAQTTLGILALGRQEHENARRHFEEALRKTPDSARTLLGKGLVEMSAGDFPSAATAMERGATIFGTHLGSWIAAGWAYLLGNKISEARKCFDKALALDDAFAESHGSLAVVDVVEGRMDEARRRIAVAIRLDRESFSAAFASACIAAGEGREGTAQAILQRVITTPIGRNGYLISDALSRLSFSR